MSTGGEGRGNTTIQSDGDDRRIVLGSKFYVNLNNSWNFKRKAGQIFLFVEEIELRPKDARLYCVGSVHARNSFVFCF